MSVLLPVDTFQYDDGGRTVTALLYDIPAGTVLADFMGAFNQTVSNLILVSNASLERKVIINTQINATDSQAEIDYVDYNFATATEIQNSYIGVITADFQNKLSSFLSGAKNAAVAVGQTVGDVVTGVSTVGKALINTGSTIIQNLPLTIGIVLAIIILVTVWRK